MPTFDLRMQHTSLQFSDPAAQQHHDVEALFTEGHNFPIKTGTEAFTGADDNHNKEYLLDFASQFNHSISFEHTKPGVGRITVGSVHYPTKGAKPGDPNHEVNVKCAEKISKWLAKVGHGADLGFVNGDFNMPDRTLDVEIYEGEPDFEESPTAQPSTPDAEGSDA